MPYFATSQEWFEQSSLLLQARPTTTRITTKYNVIPQAIVVASSSRRKRKANPAQEPTPAEPTSTAATTSATAPAPPTGPKATLTLKTYDPVSGVCLKYCTDKAAEVGRLVASLGRLGRRMAALPEEDNTPAGGADAEDATMTDAVAHGTAEVVKEVAAAVPGQQQKDSKEQKVSKQPPDGKAEGGGGGGKKKKKGKK